VAACLAYFWGTNWLLDTTLGTSSASMSHQTVTARDRARSSIRPWLFMLPALLFMSVYLVYPVFETIRLSLPDRFGQSFVGFYNYAWAFRDPTFWQSALNNIGWLLIVPFFSTACGLIIAVLADRLWWGNIAKSLIFMPMAISYVVVCLKKKLIYSDLWLGIERTGVTRAIANGTCFSPHASYCIF